MDRTALELSQSQPQTQTRPQTSLVRVFLAGLAAEPDLLSAVLGDVGSMPGQIAGLALVTASHGPWPVAQRQPGARADGKWLELAPELAARLDFVLCSLGMEAQPLDPQPLDPQSFKPQPSGHNAALTYVGPGAGAATPVAAPNLPVGAADMAAVLPVVLPVVLAVVSDILRLDGMADPKAIAARLMPMLVRAASRLRAVDAAPVTLRHAAGPDDVHLARQRQPYAHFFAIEEYDVSWRRFAGSPSDTVTRAAFLSGDAVTVLPYDPVRDRVLVVEQFRAGPLARGATQCWQIEAIAGRVDPFETPEQAARREAVEEAGLILTDLRFVARYYPSPGAVSECLYSYVALTDLPDGCAGVFGVEGEAEDIRGHLISFARFMDLVTSGEIENAPLILTALWLERERTRLR